VVVNYLTAHMAMHRTANIQSGERILVQGAAGGTGTALLELGQLAALEMYGTASPAKHEIVRELGAVPIDYKERDFVEACRELKPDNLDVVFDGIGGAHLARSARTLRRRGQVVAYGLGSTAADGRQSARAIATSALAWLWAFSFNLVPGYKRVKLYSIQMLKRRQPSWFREDLEKLLALLSDGRIRPLVAERFPLGEAARAQEILAAGSTVGKLVLTFE
jgi:NADPH2:quinone reductase